jgi:hypothetical protein
MTHPVSLVFALFFGSYCFSLEFICISFDIYLCEELSQKIEYDYGDYDDYSLTGVHTHPTLNTY